MNYLGAFAISASGMTVEKTRLDVTALNLANIHSTRSADGTPFVRRLSKRCRCTGRWCQGSRCARKKRLPAHGL